MEKDLLTDLLKKNRSYRRYGDRRVTQEELYELIALTRYTGSAGNLQQLRFVPVFGEAACDAVFETLGWAGYLKTWHGPESSERPTGYIVFVSHPDAARQFNLGIDTGICAQSMLLCARTMGLGGCMLRNIKREKLLAALNLPGTYDVVLVLALGEPAERVEIVPAKKGNIIYFRDEAGVHYVPKRDVEDLILPTPLTGKQPDFDF